MYKIQCPRGRGADIVDIMIKIMDDDKSIRKYQTRRNAAELFKAENQNVIDTENSGDRVEQVHQHNNTVPRMSKELDKRKSIVTVTTLKLDGVTHEFDPTCSACGQISTFHELKKLELKPRCNANLCVCRYTPWVRAPHESRSRRRRPRQSRKRRPRNRNSNDKRNRDKLVGIDKSKKKTHREPSNAIYKLSKSWFHKSCQCSASSVNSPVSKCTHCTSTHTLMSVKPSAAPASFGRSQSIVNNLQPATTSDRPRSKPKPSRHSSVSSYNSYFSSDHEPMDTEK